MAYSPPNVPFTGPFAMLNGKIARAWVTLNPAPYGPLFIALDHVVAAPAASVMQALVALRLLALAALVVCVISLRALLFGTPLLAVVALDPQIVEKRLRCTQRRTRRRGGPGCNGRSEAKPDCRNRSCHRGRFDQSSVRTSRIARERRRTEPRTTSGSCIDNCRWNGRNIGRRWERVFARPYMAWRRVRPGRIFASDNDGTCPRHCGDYRRDLRCRDLSTNVI